MITLSINAFKCILKIKWELFEKIKLRKTIQRNTIYKSIIFTKESYVVIKIILLKINVLILQGIFAKLSKDIIF